MGIVRSPRHILDYFGDRSEEEKERKVSAYGLAAERGGKYRRDFLAGVRPADLRYL